MTRNKKYLVVFFAFLFLQIVSAPLLGARQYFFKQISLLEGVSSTVRSVYTDAYGFVWIGTGKGLGRFDGNELHKYTFEKGNPASLPDNHVERVTGDSEGNIWVLTDKGVVRYNRRNDNFEPLTDADGTVIRAYAVALCDRGVLFGCRGEVYLYDYRLRSCSLISARPLEDTPKITDMALVDDHLLLCNSRWSGLEMLDLKSGEWCSTPFNRIKGVMTMGVDSRHRVWLSPYNKGLCCYDSRGGLLAHYTSGNSELSNDVILCLEERKGRIWIGTDGGGISVLDPESGSFELFKHIPGKEKYSLPTQSVLCLYNDHDNNMWAGSIRNGLINIREVSMETYMEGSQGNSYCLSNKTILCLYEESDEKIWIGTDGGGINLLNPRTGSFVNFATTFEDKVASIVPFTGGRLLISLFAKGLFVFDPATGRKQPLTMIDEQTNEQLCKSGKTVNLITSADGESILMLADHLYRYDLATRRFTLIEEPDKEPVAGNLLFIDQNEDYTYVSDIKHIYRLDNRRNRLSSVFRVYGDTMINSASIDENGQVWIGTNSGLSCLNPDTGEVRNVSSKFLTEVSLVLCDRKGKVWLGTDDMLFAWFIAEEKFRLFGESDGAQRNEYIPKAKLLCRNGDIYMGGTRGLLHIDNNERLFKSDTPELQLSDLVVNGESAKSRLSGERSISMPWNSNFVIKVMAKEADIFRRRLYRFQIDGYEEEYIETYTPYLAMRSLPAGNYTIRVACNTKEGGWTPDQELLSVTVLAPWYNTWWFMSLCVALIVAGIVISFRMAVRRKESKLKEAMHEYEKRARDERERFLINISHELRTPLTLIHAHLSEMFNSISSAGEQEGPLKVVYRQAERMRNLVSMVLDVCRTEVGENRIVIEPYPLNRWIEEHTLRFVSEAEAKGIRLVYELDPQIGLVSFDGDKCEIIVSNLLINSLKHSPQGSEITISTRLIDAQQRVRIAVKDQSEGVPRLEDMDHPFSGIYHGMGESYGMGIGLSYSRILARLHGGAIGVEGNPPSADGGQCGATFYLELPLLSGKEERVCQVKSYLNELMDDIDSGVSEAVEEFDLSPYTLLLVDDNKDLTDFFRAALEGHFKEVIVSKDGVEALSVIRSHTPDIVISDVMMPRMNGYELCRNIKEDFSISHIPVILLTARGDRQSQLSGYKNGADAYLTKPFEMDMLMELVRSRLKLRNNIKKQYLNAGLIVSPEGATFSQADETFLLRLNKLILDNMADGKCDITFLCREIGMSRASLYNKLKVITGMSAGNYINKIRMERAITLIRTTDMSFTEIADKLGFSTSRYFSTAFKQFTGETPSQYKLSHTDERSVDK